MLGQKNKHYLISHLTNLKILFKCRVRNRIYLFGKFLSNVSSDRNKLIQIKNPGYRAHLLDKFKMKKKTVAKTENKLEVFTTVIFYKIFF